MEIRQQCPAGLAPVRGIWRERRQAQRQCSGPDKAEDQRTKSAMLGVFPIARINPVHVLIKLDSLNAMRAANRYGAEPGWHHHAHWQNGAGKNQRRRRPYKHKAAQMRGM